MPPVDAHNRAVGLRALAEGGTGEELPAPAAAPAPEPICPYCHRACVGPDHYAYAVLHWNDPIEVKKRDEEATKVMYGHVGKPLPDWYWR